VTISVAVIIEIKHYRKRLALGTETVTFCRLPLQTILPKRAQMSWFVQSINEPGSVERLARLGTKKKFGIQEFLAAIMSSKEFNAVYGKENSFRVMNRSRSHPR